MKKRITLNLLHTVSFIVMLTGAIGSLALTLHAGHTNNSVLLRTLFAIWVLSPFTALIIANYISGIRRVLPRVTLNIRMLLIPIVSFLIYSGIFSITGSKPAFVFIVVPLISWMVILAFIFFAVLQSKRQSR